MKPKDFIHFEPKTIGHRIQAERHRFGLSQEAFGKMGGIGRTSQILYEHDERTPNADYLAKLDGNGIDILYIITGRRQDEAPQPKPQHVAVNGQAQRLRDTVNYFANALTAMQTSVERTRTWLDTDYTPEEQ